MLTAHVLVSVVLSAVSGSAVPVDEIGPRPSSSEITSAAGLIHAGKLYMSNGQNELALKSFEPYFRDVPNAANAAQVKLLTAKLR